MFSFDDGDGVEYVTRIILTPRCRTEAGLIDTNVFVYAVAEDSPYQAAAAETKRGIAERIADPQGKIQTALAEMARSSEAFLVAGGFPEASDDAARPFNTALVYGPDGSLVASYRKIHLFDVALLGGRGAGRGGFRRPGAADRGWRGRAEMPGAARRAPSP